MCVCVSGWSRQRSVMWWSKISTGNSWKPLQAWQVGVSHQDNCVKLSMSVLSIARPRRFSIGQGAHTDTALCDQLSRRNTQRLLHLNVRLFDLELSLPSAFKNLCRGCTLCAEGVDKKYWKKSFVSCRYSTAVKSHISFAQHGVVTLCAYHDKVRIVEKTVWHQISKSEDISFVWRKENSGEISGYWYYCTSTVSVYISVSVPLIIHQHFLCCSLPISAPLLRPPWNDLVRRSEWLIPPLYGIYRLRHTHVAHVHTQTDVP